MYTDSLSFNVMLPKHFFTQRLGKSTSFSLVGNCSMKATTNSYCEKEREREKERKRDFRLERERKREKVRESERKRTRKGEWERETFCSFFSQPEGNSSWIYRMDQVRWDWFIGWPSLRDRSCYCSVVGLVDKQMPPLTRKKKRDYQEIVDEGNDASLLMLTREVTMTAMDETIAPANHRPYIQSSIYEWRSDSEWSPSRVNLI